MVDCFIGYALPDEKLARMVADLLIAKNVSAFLANVSLKPGQNWSGESQHNLETCKWAILLATKDAASASYVNQELGSIMGAVRKMVPVVWDIPPKTLPGWIDQAHVLDLKGRVWPDVPVEVDQVATAVRVDKALGRMIVKAILFALLWLSSK